MDERDLLNLVNSHEKAAIGSSNGAANIATSGTTTQYGAVDVERAQALDYYHGRPLGNEVEGRSQVVTQEVRDAIEWIKPQIMRMFVSTQKEIARFDPENPQDEQEAKQATDLVNYIFMRRNNGIMVLHDFFTDALILKNGYVKVWYEEVTKERFENYSGLDEMELVGVIQAIEQKGEEAEITAQEEQHGFTQGPDGQLVPNVTYDVRIRCTRKEGEYKVECIPTEDMRVSPLTTHSLQDSPFVGHVVRKTRSEWKELGYDVENEPSDKGPRLGIQSIARSDTVDELGTDDPGSDKSMEIVEGLECYVRVDYDGDGYAELRKVLKAPGKIVENEPIEEVPIAHCVPIRMPHRHLGISLYDILKDVQDTKTTLNRQLLDNVYTINNGRLVVNVDNVNMEDLSISRAGGFIRTTGSPGADITPLPTPSMVNELLPVISHMDSVTAHRTGISASTQGLDPDTLQGSTAKAYQTAMNASTAKIELMARMMAEGVKDIALLLHGLIIRHQDKPMAMKLRNDWVEVDPRSWRKRYACSVNVGLGTGSREEMRSNLMMLGQVQQAAAQAGIVQPDNVFAMASEMAETLGFSTPTKFFTDPSSPQFKHMQSQKAQQPDPRIALEHAKMQSKMQVEQAKLQQKSQSEHARMQSDIIIERAKQAAQQQTDLMDTAAQEHSKMAQALLQADIEREKMLLQFASQIGMADAKAQEDVSQEALRAMNQADQEFGNG